MHEHQTTLEKKEKMHIGTIWNQKETILDEQFAFVVAQEVKNLMPTPKSILEAKHGLEWHEWEKLVISS